MAATIASMVTALASSDSTVYALSEERRIVRTNPAWTRFALANDGADLLPRWSRGALIDDALMPSLRTFYLAAFARVRETGEVWYHDYECSSPELFRRFRMSVYAASGGFLVIVNALLVEMPHPPAAALMPPSTYEVEGLITMCGHCRKSRRPGIVERWDWVPSHLDRRVRNISHGLCEACQVYHYGIA